VEGIKELRIGDGKVYITCADAVDELSPPVHYDLYYLDTSTHEGQGQITSFIGHENTQVVYDIAKDFELEWPNRKGVALTVRARDSAKNSNSTNNVTCMETAPTNLHRVPINENVPGSESVDPDKFVRIKQLSEFERLSRTLYVCYEYEMEGNVYPAGVVRILAVDINW
jgi:hypothetical protein